MIENLFTANQELHDDTIAKVLEQQFLAGNAEGALGRLDEMVMKLASHQQTPTPKIEKPWVSIFAADHGVVAEDVSEFEQSKTRDWVVSLCEEKAASNALIQHYQLDWEVIDVGIQGESVANDKYLDAKVSDSTANFTTQAAMTQEQMLSALQVGMAAAERAKAAGADLFISGEVGVGNTTSALAMAAVMSGKPVMELLEIGRERVMRSDRHRAEVIEKAINLHKEQLTSPLKIMQHLGGFETAALCGAYIRCAQLGLTVVVDGVMASVAAWIADMVSRNDQLLHCKSVEELMDLGQYSVPETMFCICGTCPRLVEWCFFAHQSAENFHSLVLEILAVDPILQFDMKHGQASGALLTLPLLQQACIVNQQLVSQLPEQEDSVATKQDEDNCPFF